MAWIIAGIGLVVVLRIIWLFRLVDQQPIFFDESGEAWKPRFLIVMFQKEVESDLRNDQTNDDDNSVSSNFARRYAQVASMGFAAEAYGILFEEVADFGEAIDCDWTRAYDLRGISKRRQEVLYAHASNLVEHFRKNGIKAYAGVIPEWNKKPLVGTNFSELIDHLVVSGFPQEMGICGLIGIPLAHANIKQLANMPTGLSKLLPRQVSPIELLEGMNSWVSGKKPPK